MNLKPAERVEDFASLSYSQGNYETNQQRTGMDSHLADNGSLYPGNYPLYVIRNLGYHLRSPSVPVCTDFYVVDR